eukprot:2760553-Amphidinium_carterae.1
MVSDELVSIPFLRRLAASSRITHSKYQAPDVGNTGPSLQATRYQSHQSCFATLVNNCSTIRNSLEQPPR